MSEIYNENSSAILLGILCNDCSKYLDNKYTLESNDFKPILLHQIVFGVCKNLAIKGAKSIDIIEIEEFLKNYEAQFNSYKDNNGSEFINTIKQLGEDSKDNIDYYYNNVRKHSLLREYKNNGFEIKEIWDCDKSIDSNENELDKWEIDDICEYFEKKQIEINKKYKNNSITEEIKLGNWFMDIKEDFKKEPLCGTSMFSNYLNTATRGFIKGQLTVFSAPSGTGKSSIAVNMAVLTSATRIYDSNKGCYIDNKKRANDGFLIIQYELNTQLELSPKVVACISDVPCNHILNGNYEEGEEDRVNEAIKIMEESNIYVVTMPTFTTESIEACIKDYVISHNVGYVVFDYLSSTATLNSSVALKNKTQTRIDTVVSQLSATLKQLALTLNVAVMSFTQCNDTWRTEEILGSNVVAEAKAIANKCDIAGVFTPCRQKEYKLVDTFMLHNDKIKRGFNNKPLNIRILHLYKVRFGSEQQGIKIWLSADLSTCRFTDLWVTTKENKPYKIDTTELENDL